MKGTIGTTYEYFSIACENAYGSIRSFISRLLNEFLNKRISIFLLFFLFTAVSIPQELPTVRINEFMASNVTIYPDNVDFDDYSDWIELKNTSHSSISLNGFYLTDDLESPLKWPFPQNASIPANGFLTIRADGFNANPNDQARREFSPWREFTVQHLHTNFRLSAEGESIGLYKLNGIVDSKSLISLDATWKFNDLGLNLENTWRSIEYDDTGWQSGNAPLGYGDDTLATHIDFGSSSRRKHPTYYFRHSFNADDISESRQVNIRFSVDDGTVIYLNNQEIHRTRMQNGVVNYDSLASQTAPEGIFETMTFSANLLREGTNVLAVEVHQASRNSSDIHWELEMWSNQSVGEPPVLVDSIVYDQQYPDVSFGRNKETPEVWSYFGEPTPNQPNSRVPMDNLTHVGEVEFSLDSGFYPSEITLQLTAFEQDAQIHYTLDSTIPTSQSPIYTGPLSISQTTIIRTRTFLPGKIPGDVQTHSYFINEPAYSLPVVSLSVEPDVFFGNDIGIYQNIHKGREAPVNLAFFETDKLAFNVNAGVKIAGENIWRFPQKPLNVSLRGKYGDDLIHHQIFKNERNADFGEIAFRNGGDNWDNAMLRDAMTPHILYGQSPNDVQNYRPCVMYLNGKYWGIYNIRQKLDDVYFRTHHHINSGNYDYLEYANVISGGVGLVVKEGDSDDYLMLEQFTESNDLSNDSLFKEASDKIDLISLIDYVATEDFVYNSSWRHNREFWKERKNYAKWHWVIPDLDRGFNLRNISFSLIDNFKHEYPLIGNLMENDGFKNMLAQRYAAHLSSTFLPDRIHQILDDLDLNLESEIDRHIERWRDSGGISSRSSRNDEINEIKEFASKRHEHVIDALQGHLGMGNTVTIEFNTFPEDGGHISIAGVPALLHINRQFELFENVPISISAEPGPGYQFAGWDGLDDNTAFQNIIFTAPQSLTALFTPSDESNLSSVVSEDMTLSLEQSPYTISSNTILKKGVTMTVLPGVEIRMGPEADLLIQGNLQLIGSADQPITIHARDPKKAWGSFVFDHGDGIQKMSHVIMRHGGIGQDPKLHQGAISNIGSHLEIDHLDLSSITTIFATEGKTTLFDSYIHSPVTGDGINIKQGWGHVENSTFIGNEAADTDAIDFDGVTEGIIRGNRIIGFRGPNSDGIDIGESCVDLLIEGNRIYNNSDKGISVGQGSTVTIRKNLIVDCQMGVAVKDSGSFAYIEQNTLYKNNIGIALFEKNLRRGGGSAKINSTIISDSEDNHVYVDSFSNIETTYSLSNDHPLMGENNIMAIPDYVDSAAYNFQLNPSSQAIDQGDPALGLDEDGSLPDVGANYIFDPMDFPYIPSNLVVINEMMSHSHNEDPDWIELHNMSAAPVDISGWFLSDSKSNLKKYEIDEGTIIDANGLVTFYENDHFGPDANASKGRRIPFALSENGETIYLHAPSEGLFLDYTESETFGPSATGVSKGRYYKASTGTFNFVALANPTPNAPNSEPLVGPIIISEIMFHPRDHSKAEYIELLNISNQPVLLLDEDNSTPWRFTNGIEFAFPSNPKIEIKPDERILIVRDINVFKQTYTVPENQLILQWTSGALSNQGETLELSRPGDVDNIGVRQYIREERIVFKDGETWPSAADGMGSALIRIDPFRYGNDPSNWKAGLPSPGSKQAQASNFANWRQEWNLPPFESETFHDPDQDGRSNLMEYALQSNPLAPDPSHEPHWTLSDGLFTIEFETAAGLEDIQLGIEVTSSLNPPDWSNHQDLTIKENSGKRLVSTGVPIHQQSMFFRLVVRLIP